MQSHSVIEMFHVCVDFQCKCNANNAYIYSQSIRKVFHYPVSVYSAERYRVIALLTNQSVCLSDCLSAPNEYFEKKGWLYHVCVD